MTWLSVVCVYVLGSITKPLTVLLVLLLCHRYACRQHHGFCSCPTVHTATLSSSHGQPTGYSTQQICVFDICPWVSNCITCVVAHSASKVALGRSWILSLPDLSTCFALSGRIIHFTEVGWLRRSLQTLLGGVALLLSHDIPYFYSQQQWLGVHFIRYSCTV